MYLILQVTRVNDFLLTLRALDGSDENNVYMLSSDSVLCTCVQLLVNVNIFSPKDSNSMHSMHLDMVKMTTEHQNEEGR